MPKDTDFVQEKFKLNGGKEMALVLSQPPSGKCLVKNIYFDPVTGKLVVQYDDAPQP